MRVIRTSGSVRGGDGDIPAYSAQGRHTSSAVNVAEVAPFVSDALDRYLEAYVEIAPRLGAEWIVMHAGFHFTSDKAQRMAAGLDRLNPIETQRPRWRWRQRG